ncbi:hypothetical protein TPR58_02195 [Sphingomonas sp. HF-S3]|uniref:DUF2207 domain-containing protein n=1 Tax=Sphingomonas rustica TaxID=3103142 RepID=A0ABV0B6D8_9SPHN
MRDDAGPGEPAIRRARTLAAGLADVGLTHAEELLRRMSPEGREQARREREARARRRNRLMARMLMAAVASLLTWALVAAIVSPGVAFAAASAVMLLLILLIANRADPRVPGRQALNDAPLPALAEEAIVWLDAQHRGLPSPALRFTRSIAATLDAAEPHLARVDPRSPFAADVRKLIAEELPDLVEGWRAVPVSARRTPRADGRAPDDHLCNGLQLIDAELARATEQLDRGSFEQIEVLGRYLELKYDRDSGLA